MRVMVATGSSGGHVFPALSLMEALTKKNPAIKLLLVMPKRSAVQVKEYPVAYTSVNNIPRKLSGKTLKAAYDFIRGSYESFVLLMKFKPDIVVGFGGVGSFSPVFFSWVFRIRTLIHEQNVIPGKANQVLARIADRIAISFEDTKAHLRDSGEKVILTGNPIRQGMTEVDKKGALNFFGFSKEKTTVLVMGGSQGSQHINDAFLNTFAQLPDRSSIQVIHLTGAKEAGPFEDRYKQLGAAARVFGFFTEMQYAYSASDFAICRAGATTVTELLRFKIPAILVPYPYAYRHQLYNARVLEAHGCASIINDADLEGGALLKFMESLLQHPEIIAEMKTAYKGLAVSDAAGALAEEVLSLAC